MFLRDLTDEQKRAFLVLADKVVLADGHLAPEETMLLDTFRAEMDVADVPVPQMDLAEAAKIFDTRKARVSVLFELIALGHADGDFDKDESAVVTEIKRAFGLSLAEFEAMVNWVLRQMALVREASELMAQEA
ncbi:TerB family tellurite resistance protein [Tistrella mobilis]|uniref:TerB family tellurite resistance protein n=1 Tax=Tistrella mobilis TaxID=171437 RepID=UPI0031F71EF3